jgi:GTP-binding protein
MSTTVKQPPYTGRIAIGRLHRGILKENMAVSLVKRDSSIIKMHIKKLHTFEDVERKRVEEVQLGDICAIVGLEGSEIGDTVADIEIPEGLKFIAIDKPTMSRLFTINDSTF